MDGFEDVIKRFPKCAEGYALYAQVLCFLSTAFLVLVFIYLQSVYNLNVKTQLMFSTTQLFVPQALTDQQQFGKADEMYDKCIELEQDNATTYVHKGYVLVLCPMI